MATPSQLYSKPPQARREQRTSIVLPLSRVIVAVDLATAIVAIAIALLMHQSLLWIVTFAEIAAILGNVWLVWFALRVRRQSVTSVETLAEDTPVTMKSVG